MSSETIFTYSDNTTSTSTSNQLSQSSYDSTKTLTGVFIGSAVQSIADYCFLSVNTLTTVDFASDSILSYIFPGAFDGCSSLTSISLPNTVTTIRSSAFKACTALTSFVFPPNVTIVAAEVLELCVSLTSVTLPTTPNFTTIQGRAFNTTLLQSIVIPDSVTELGTDIFSGCPQLTSCILSANLTTIPFNTFLQCTALESIIIPNSVTSLNDSAFNLCSGLTNITLSNSLTTIGPNAFFGCISLLSITIPSTVTTIDSNAFAYTQLRAITFEDQHNLTTINTGFGLYVINPDESAYYPTVTYNNTAGVSDLSTVAAALSWHPNTRIKYNNIATVFTYSDSTTSTSSDTTISSSSYDSNKTLTGIFIGTNLTTIDSNTFYSKTTLVNVEFSVSTSLTNINDNAFVECSSITSIILPNTVTTLGTSVFSGCSSLTSCQLSSNITHLPNNTFENCGFTSFIIPNTITTMGTYVFQGCTSLTSCTFPENLTIIPEFTFINCVSLTSVTFPTTSNFTIIDQRSFANCTALTSITIPNSVTYIGSGVFTGCGNLSSIIIPNSVTSIGMQLFQHCYNLASCTLSSIITVIPDICFENCFQLTSIIIPSSVTTIGWVPFLRCINLANIIFENQHNLIEVNSNSGFSTVNSAGTPNYPTVTFFSTNNITFLSSAAASIEWPANTIFRYNPYASCYNEGTKILCLNRNFEEEYIPIQNLRKGDLVKSYKHGYRKIDLIGKGFGSNNKENDREMECMYKMVKTEENGLTEDLMITGWHSILVDNLGSNSKKVNQLLNKTIRLDDKYLMPASLSSDFVKVDNTDTFVFYHLILENDGDDDNERYGIWANGLLTETPTKKNFLSYPYILL